MVVGVSEPDDDVPDGDARKSSRPASASFPAGCPSLVPRRELSAVDLRRDASLDECRALIMVMAAEEAALDGEGADDDEGEDGEGAAGWSGGGRDSSGRLEGASDGSVEARAMVEARRRVTTAGAEADEMKKGDTDEEDGESGAAVLEGW